MRITINRKSFAVTLADNTLSQSISAMCPIKLNMSRSGGHEYYAALPKKVNTAGAPETSLVHRGGIYYFAVWNAFSLVFKDADIAPYSVHIVGEAEDELVSVLEHSDGTITITMEE